MCKRNSPHENEASTGCVRETPHIKKEKRTHHGMCKKKIDNYREMSNELFWKRCVGSGSLSLCFYLCVSRFGCFVL